MHCRYCGARIIWMEGQGWLIVGFDDEILWRTTYCAGRDVPSKGHRLP